MLVSTDRLGLYPDIQQPDNDPTLFDQIQDWIADQAGDAFDASLTLIVGENFERLAVDVFTQIPTELGKIAGDNPDLASLKPNFSASAARELAFTFAVMVAIEKGADFIIPKPTPWAIAGQAVIFLTRQALRAYIAYEFGSAAVDYFDKLRTLGDVIVDLAKTDYGCEDVEKLAGDLAQTLADGATDGVGGLANYLGKFRFKRKSNDKKTCKEPKTKEQHNECYSRLRGFSGLNLTVAEVNALEKAVGADSRFCTEN